MYKTEFSKDQKQYDLVKFTVTQLGLPSGTTTSEIYARAEELGLKLCPPEIGPQLRLVYPRNEWLIIAMKQITDRRGRPRVFYLISDELYLSARGAESSDEWDAGSGFVFRLRKLEA